MSSRRQPASLQSLSTEFSGAATCQRLRVPALSSRAVARRQVSAAPVASAATLDETEEDEAPPVFPPLAAFKLHGTGRRKTAVARVGLIEGTGRIYVNGLPLDDYFQGQQLMIQSPLSSLGYEARYDLKIRCHGGGINAQSQAIVMGIARALVMANANNRPPLKAQGMLTRDARAVERKKYGLKKARKAPQFSKR
eukprot:jgi/Mesen1/8147/ME000438S07254